MSVLIVVESAFGNTHAVAQHIAEGISGVRGADQVTLVRVGQAPRELPTDVDLLLVGAPTHDFTLSKPGTRKQATDKSATEVEHIGVREWIERVTPRPTLRTVTFDTSFEKFLSGSAAKAAAKALSKRGFRLAERGESFHVQGRSGPLNEGEEKRATTWAAELA